MQQIKVKWVLWSWREQPFLTKVLPGGIHEEMASEWRSGKVPNQDGGNRMSKEKSGLGVLFRLM